MTRDIIGEIIFWATLAFGLALYFFSAPSGLPWNGSTELALAYGGYVEELPDMAHPVWGYFIQVFGGHYVALSAVAMAVAGGLIGALANRYFGWRFGAAAAIAWIVLPPVWNRAVTGAYGSFWAFGIVFAAWLANAVFLFVTRRARWNMETSRNTAQSELTSSGRFTWINRIAAWALLGASAAFAIVSVASHDYTIGEAASAYARATLDEAGDRMVILNGLADDQMIWEEVRRQGAEGKGKRGEGRVESRLICFRNDAAYRTQLVARVRREWPAETNFWIAAQIGPETFADLAIKSHPERMHVMTGQTTTPEKWAARWAAMKPYLGSSDRFIPAMRRAFAYEGNVIGNRLQGEGKLKEAWEVYGRIATEIDRANVSALVNQSEMVRRGYPVGASVRQHIEDAMAELHKNLKGAHASKIAAAMVATCGPVMPDSQVMAEYRAEIERRMKEAEKVQKDGGEWEMPERLKSLFELNEKMLKAYDGGDIAAAARIARTILARPEGSGFIPANAVMGTAMSVEGDYVASEAFYRIALAGAQQPPAVCNDYADTLRHLGRLDEAEKYARMAVAKADGKSWLFELTLAEVLRDAGKNPDEMKRLLDQVAQNAPAVLREKVRREFKK